MPILEKVARPRRRARRRLPARCSPAAAAATTSTRPTSSNMPPRSRSCASSFAASARSNTRAKSAASAGPALGYRNRIQLHLRNQQIGYLAAGSHELVPVSACPIASPRLNEAHRPDSAERHARAEVPAFRSILELFTNETDVQMNVLETERPVAQWFYKSCESVVALDYPTRLRHFPRQSAIVLPGEPVPARRPGSARGTGRRRLYCAGPVRRRRLVRASSGGEIQKGDCRRIRLHGCARLQFTARLAPSVALDGVNARVEDYL